MAEVATKKSINVVSNKKTEVCSVQSNNGLIDLDNITASNNQLISLCDTNDDEDDLILTNNTRNELDTDDKSLQELIESELALRICANNDKESTAHDPEEPPEVSSQPETVKKIILDRREDAIDVNTEFIAHEATSHNLIETYGCQNGHVSPETQVTNVYETTKPEVTSSQLEDEQERFIETSEVGDTRKTIDDTESTRDSDDRLALETEVTEDQCPRSPEVTNDTDDSIDPVVPQVSPRVDKYQTEEEVDEHVEDLAPDVVRTDLVEQDTRVTLETGPDCQIGQFSDNFDENLWTNVQTTQSQSETVRMSFLDSVQDTMVNPDLVGNEVTTCDLVQNGHVSPDTQMANTYESSTPRPVPSRYEEEERLVDTSEVGDVTRVVQKTTDDTQSTRESDGRLSMDTEVTVDPSPKLPEGPNDTDNTTDPIPQVSRVPVDKYQVEEEVDKLVGDTDVVQNDLVNENTQDPEVDNPRDESKVSSDTPGCCVPKIEEPEDTQETPTVQSRSFDDGTLSHSEASTDAASTQEFIDMERRVLNEETRETENDTPVKNTFDEEEREDDVKDDESKDETNDTLDDQNQIAESSSELSVSEPTFIEKTEVVISDTSVTIFSEMKYVETGPETESVDSRRDPELETSSLRAPLATPDDETSDVPNECDSESREETITTSTSVVTTTNTKGGTKTKKKKIEGVAGNDASPNLTPRTKKTKKSKKSDLEKENISVNSNLQDTSMHTGPRQTHPETFDFSGENDLSNVNVKSLTQNYVSEASRNEQERSNKERIATGVSIKQLCRSFGDISNMSDGDQTTFGRTIHSMETEEKARSMGDLRVCERGYSSFTKDAVVFTGVSVKALRASYCSLANLTNEGKDTDRPRFEKSSFNKFDALSKKTVLHVRSVDAGKVQQQLNAVGQNGDTNPNCRSCGKVVFQMEQTKAEGLVWHKNCFRCVQCSKQLNVDNYESHESTLYCKPHFKELFQPKPVEESDQPVRPRKPELIIRENEPKELPPDVVRASDKPDLGLKELSSLNVKSRFQVFEKAGAETNEIERSPSQIAVKRSPSILSKLAKFQAKGMDIGVADESLNGIPYEESSESEEEEELEETEELDTEIVKAKRTTRERPISFSKMDDIKNRWETTSQQGRREVQREARKEEIAGIRSRLFMGKQGKMKEMYQQAVAGSERVTKINAAEEIQHSTHARSIKERFERGETLATSDDETDSKPKPEKADEEVIAAGISRKSRSLFLELDASAAKTGRPVTPVNPKTPAEAPRRARDAFMGRQVSDDVVRSSDATEEVQVETSDITNKFKFFESYKEPEKQRKQFRITPPRDGQVKMESPDREIYRDPEVVRAEDRVNDLVHTDTARKMLSIFRQMEENACKKELPNGPKPLKRFTPPPEDKFAKATASDSEEEEEEEGEESEGEESAEERDPNYVRASDKVEDEFLKQAQHAARAKTLCAKFEHWEETDGKTISGPHVPEMEIAQGEQLSIESASSLRARFESLGSQTADSPRTPKVKVNRFVEIQTTCTDVCESCEKKVYPLEKVETNNKIFHKQCFRCLQCNCVLRMDTFTLNNGKLYCIPHFKQLFITRGNYDEGFGVDPHKNKWSTTNSSSSSSPSPIAVSNGDL